MIVITETDLPLLTINIPENLINNKVNINDDIFIDIFYEESADNAYYSLILLYKFEITATKKYEYTTFKFKIWDLQSDFDFGEP